MLRKLLDRFSRKGTSRPRSKVETEKRRRLLVVLLIVLAVVASVSIVGYGYYDTGVKPWNQRIVKVNGTVIEMRSFVKTTRTWVLLYQLYYGSATTPSSELAQSVATSMEDNELMRQGLEREFPDVDIGSVTSDEAVEARIRGMLVGDNATDEAFNEQYDSFVTSLKRYGLSGKDFKELYIKPLLIGEELKKQIGDAQYPATDNFEHAQVQALLVKGSDNATLMRTRWENGEAFDTLSTDNSVSSYQRDLAADNTTVNWVARGIKSVAFDSYAFSENTSLDVISQPILDTDSSENYWVIKVLARESRQLSDTDRDTLVSAAFTTWLEAAKNSEDYEIVNYLNEKGGTAKLAWALDHVAVS